MALSQRLTEKINRLISEIEKEKGNMCELDLHIYGSCEHLKFGKIAERKRGVKVYDMQEMYRDIEGEYMSIKDVISQIDLLRRKDDERLGVWGSSKWTSVDVSTMDENIYVSDGGSIGICRCIGKYMFI